MGCRILRIAFAVVPCLLAAESWASAPTYVPLATMISQAESIAIVQIDKIVPIERPKNSSTIWWPNQTVTLKVEQTLRGSLSKTVTARVEVSKYKNPSAKSRERALLFVGRMIPWKDAPAKPASMVDAFEAAQGFMVLADLGRLENEQDRFDALAAIRSSIKNHRPVKGMKSYGWSPVLNDAAAKPFFDLLKSKSSALRRWAIQRGVDYVQITPYIASTLIGLLSDRDRTLARSAARHLMQRRYLPASKNLREFAAKDDELGHTILCYLQGRKIEDILDHLNQDAQTRILPHVPNRAKSPAASSSIDFRVSKSGELRHNETSQADVPAALAVQIELEKVDWKTMEVRPFRFDVFVWRDATGLQFRVREQNH